jgi:hypothetical protein
MNTESIQADCSQIKRALMIAGVLIGVSAMLSLLSPEHLSSDLASRALGVLLGGVTVWYANAAPKALRPLVEMRCDPVAEQSMRRFAGWSIAVGGILYALAWAAAPIGIARLLSIALLGTALLLVVVRFGWGMSRGITRP